MTTLPATTSVPLCGRPPTPRPNTAYAPSKQTFPFYTA